MPLEAEMDLRATLRGATTSIGVAGVRSPICAGRANRRGLRRQRARPAGAVALARVAVVRPDFGARASPIRVDETRLSGRARPAGELVDPSTRAIPWRGKVATRGTRFTRRIDGGRRGRAGGDEQRRAHERHGEAEALRPARARGRLPRKTSPISHSPRPLLRTQHTHDVFLLRRIEPCRNHKVLVRIWRRNYRSRSIRRDVESGPSRADTARSPCRSGSPHPHRAPSVGSSPRRP
jgi:hypothetical protein